MARETGSAPEVSNCEALKHSASSLKSIVLAEPDLALLELLGSGYCGPQVRYMGRAEVAAILDGMSGTMINTWPLPIVFTVTSVLADRIAREERIALHDSEGAIMGILTVEEKWAADELPHAGMAELEPVDEVDTVFLAGPVAVVERRVHHDFPAQRLGPGDLQAEFVEHGWKAVLACQPDGIIHREEAWRISFAARVADAKVLVQALVRDADTLTRDHFSRIRCLHHVLRHLAEGSSRLTIVPGIEFRPRSREVLWRAMLARNAGATHLLVEPEWWLGASLAERGRIVDVARSMGIELVDLPRFVGGGRTHSFVPTADEVAVTHATTDIVRLIRAGEDVPDWMSFPEVIEELRRSYPARRQQGVAVFFTGLSGAGKSTIARVLLSMLLEMGERTVTLLDGDVVRKHLSSELGFSREHRDINIMRIGYVASEIAKHGGIAICAPIAPYRATRRRVRELVSLHGGFLEVHVATPLETCEARDRKGLYAKARAGVIKEFTGISDPYETPEHAEIVIDTRACTPVQAAQAIVERLKADGFLR